MRYPSSLILCLPILCGIVAASGCDRKDSRQPESGKAVDSSDTRSPNPVRAKESPSQVANVSSPNTSHSAGGGLPNVDLEAIRVVEAECLQYWRFAPAFDPGGATWELKHNEWENLPYHEAALSDVTATTRLEAQFDQVKSIFCRIEQRPLNDADRLNGVQWRGRVTFGGTLDRSYAIKPQAGAPGWSRWRDGRLSGYLLIGRDLTKQNGAWESVAPFLERGQTNGTPGDPDAPPAEIREMHLRDASKALRAGQWQQATDEAVSAAHAAAEPATPSQFGMPEKILTGVVQRFNSQDKPDPSLANAAATALSALSESKAAEAQSLALSALRHINRQSNSDALDPAVISIAAVLAVKTADKKDETEIREALKGYIPLSIAHGHGEGAGAKKVAETLAVLDNPEWAKFKPFEPSAILRDFKSAWWSRGEKIKGRDPIDRSSETFGLMDALFQKLGKPSITGEGQHGLTLGTGYSVWVTGPRDAMVRGTIEGDKAKPGDSYILILKPDASGGWLIAGIRNIVLAGQPLSSESLDAEHKARAESIVASFTGGKALSLTVGATKCQLTLARAADAGAWEGKMLVFGATGKVASEVPVKGTLDGEGLTLVSDPIIRARTKKQYVLTVSLKLDQAGKAMVGVATESGSGAIADKRPMRATLQLDVAK